MTRDERGMLLQSTSRDPKSGLTENQRFEYDVNGNPTLHVDGAGHSQAWRYGESDLPTHILEPSGVIRELQYGAGGLLYRERARHTQAAETELGRVVEELTHTLENN
jgi:uncharacterized protein RhaS with RHS repeats